MCGIVGFTIPSGMTKIGSYAFQECSGLTSVTIPSSVTEIGDDAFYGCNNLRSLTMARLHSAIADSLSLMSQIRAISPFSTKTDQWCSSSTEKSTFTAKSVMLS